MRNDGCRGREKYAESPGRKTEKQVDSLTAVRRIRASVDTATAL